MKLKLYFMLLALGAISLQSCDNDDDIDGSDVPENIRTTFSENYPDTRNLKWGAENVSQQQYYKAEFNNKKENGYKTSAWYAADGTWRMTETEMPYNAIPTAIRTAFESSQYAAWKKDNEVDKVARVGAESVYIIEVESVAGVDMDLYYSESGVLIKAVSDQPGNATGNGSLLPDAPADVTSAVTAFIKEKYPNARIVEIDVEHGLIEVDIIDDNKGKEVLFDSSNVWISTSWDVSVLQLPAVITDAIKASPQYNTYRIDDAEYVETPSGDYYLIELESGKQEVKVKIDLTGLFIK